MKTSAMPRVVPVLLLAGLFLAPLPAHAGEAPASHRTGAAPSAARAAVPGGRLAGSAREAAAAQADARTVGARPAVADAKDGKKKSKKKKKGMLGKLGGAALVVAVLAVLLVVAAVIAVVVMVGRSRRRRT